MTNEEIREELKETIINLYNCTDDAKMKVKLNRILNGDIVLRCKCPMCGEKFVPEDGMKLSERIL
jgi:transcription initiation factor IIE alpha subunit